MHNLGQRVRPVGFFEAIRVPIFLVGGLGQVIRVP